MLTGVRAEIYHLEQEKIKLLQTKGMCSKVQMIEDRLATMKGQN